MAAQQRIVAEIEKQFTRLEAGVAALRRVQANLKRYRAAVLKAACEGKLVPTEHELSKSEVRIKKDEAKSPKSRASTSSFLTPTSSFYESGEALLQRILAERRKNWTGRGKYKEPAAPDTANLPPLPEGWTWASVDQVCDVASGNTVAGMSAKLRSTGEIPWFKVGDMNADDNRVVMKSTEAWLSRTDADSLGLRVFPRGTILFPKRGGAIATNKKRRLENVATADANVMGLTPDHSLAVFFWWWFQSVNLASLSDGSNVPQVNNKDILPLAMPLPPLAEQTRIVAEVERRLSVVEELESVVSANLQRASRLRQSILQKAFTGGLI
ncbi:MAG: restriction endonuclease subunit S [Verrucomicrobiota bacterium]